MHECGRELNKSLKLTIVVLLMLALHAVPALADDFDIKFGLMKKDTAGKYYVYAEDSTCKNLYPVCRIERAPRLHAPQNA